MIKHLFLIFAVITYSTASFAHLKPKEIIGKWNYEIVLSNAQLEGSFLFVQKNGKLKGENVSSEGIASKLNNLKVNKKNETLCFQVYREDDVPIGFILIVNHNKFRGKGWINDVSFEITGNKIENKEANNMDFELKKESDLTQVNIPENGTTFNEYENSYQREVPIKGIKMEES